MTEIVFSGIFFSQLIKNAYLESQPFKSKLNKSAINLRNKSSMLSMLEEIESC